MIKMISHVFVCVFFYYIAYNRATRPCHPCFTVTLTLVLSREDPRSCSRSDPHPGVLAHSRTTCSRSHPRPCPCFRNRFLLLVPGSSFSCRYHIVGQTPSLSPEATGYLRVPPSACGVDAAPGIMAAPSLLPIRICFQQQTVL